MSAAERLAKWVERFLSDEITVVEFCGGYEGEFNLKTRRSELSPRQDAVFQALFDEVVYFSPYDEDLKAYPGYRDELAIRAAAERALHELSSIGA